MLYYRTHAFRKYVLCITRSQGLRFRGAFRQHMGSATTSRGICQSRYSCPALVRSFPFDCHGLIDGPYLRMLATADHQVLPIRHEDDLHRYGRVKHACVTHIKACFHQSCSVSDGYNGSKGLNNFMRV